MGIWIVIGIILFVLGNIMALKPSSIDQRLDNLRMTARKLELNPKLIACPDWIKGKNNELGKGMIGQYSVIDETYKLPHAHYQIIDGQLRPLEREDTDNLNNSADSTASNIKFLLDKQPLQLPDSIQPFVKGVYTKANSIIIFWEDASYVKPVTNPKFNKNNIEPELIELRERLKQLAEIVR